MIWWACFSEYMQQNREQYGLPIPVLSRDPAQSTNATFFGCLPVARSDQVSAGRSGCTDKPLELEAGDDVLEPLVSPLFFFSIGEDVVPGGEDCRPDLDLDELVLGLEVDCLLLRPQAVTQRPHLIQESKSMV